MDYGADQHSLKYNIFGKIEYKKGHGKTIIALFEGYKYNNIINVNKSSFFNIIYIDV